MIYYLFLVLKPQVFFSGYKSVLVGSVIHAPLVMVSIGARKRSLAGQTAYKNGSIDTSFEPPLFSLDSTFNTRIFLQ
jgi:hypothetical protein